MENLDAMCVRLLLKIQVFTPEVVYIPGKNNNLADFLSRLCNRIAKDDLNYTFNVAAIQMPPIEIKPINNWNKDEMLKAQKGETFCQTVMAQLEKGNTKPKFNGCPINAEFKTLDKLLFLVEPLTRDYKTDQFRLVIPDKLKAVAIALIHDTPAGGHAGIERTHLIFNRRFFLRNSSIHISNYVKNCTLCQIYKNSPPPTAPLSYYPQPQRPFEVVHMDFSDPNNLSEDMYKYILVLRYCLI